MLIFNILASAMFLYFAYLNLNDSDAALWVGIYGLAALGCVLGIFGYFFPMGYLLLSVFCGVYAIFLFFSKNGVWDWLIKYRAENIAATMQATKPWIEKTREFFGLLIVIFVMGINWLAVN